MRFLLFLLLPSTLMAGGPCYNGVCSQRFSYVQPYQQPLNIVNYYPQGGTLYTNPSISQYGQAYQANPNLAIAAIQDQQRQLSANLQSAMQLQTQSQSSQAEIAKLQLASQIIKQALSSPQVTQAVQQQVTTSLGTHCAKCHGPANPKGGITLDGSAALSDAHVARITYLLSGKAQPQEIPAEMQPILQALSKEARNGVLGESLDLWERN